MINFIALDADKNSKSPLMHFLEGSNGHPVDSIDFNYDATYPTPIAFRGITKKELIYKCWKDNRTFYYIDTGYFANFQSPNNPKGYKKWHRVVKNNVQHLQIDKKYPDDRWNNLQYELPKLKWTGWKKDGKDILLVAPSAKPCKFYNIERDTWLNNTILELKKYTKRNIIVREKPNSRSERANENSIYSALDNDVFAVVTYNSIAAIESVAYGIPTFTLAPNAAEILTSNDLSNIENPYYPSEELVHEVCCFLAYKQFSIQELSNGAAWSMINES